MNSSAASARFWRFFLYGVGVILLALGVTLNTRTGLGVSPITSIPYSISIVFDWNFAAVTFVVYILLVGVQLVLKGKSRSWFDLLQIPFSLVFSLLLDFFERIFPWTYSHLWQNLVMLAFAIVCTAVGISFTVGTKLIPNPADGFANVLGIVLGRGVGFGKNVADLCSVAITAAVGLVFAGKLVGIGLGTVLAMILVGRVITLFNHLVGTRLLAMAGMVGAQRRSAPAPRPGTADA